jgi:hypothetical protein
MTLALPMKSALLRRDCVSPEEPETSMGDSAQLTIAALSVSGGLHK